MLREAWSRSVHTNGLSDNFGAGSEQKGSVCSRSGSRNFPAMGRSRMIRLFGVLLVIVLSPVGLLTKPPRRSMERSFSKTTDFSHKGSTKIIMGLLANPIKSVLDAGHPDGVALMSPTDDLGSSPSGRADWGGGEELTNLFTELLRHLEDEIPIRKNALEHAPSDSTVWSSALDTADTDDQTVESLDLRSRIRGLIYTNSFSRQDVRWYELKKCREATGSSWVFAVLLTFAGLWWELCCNKVKLFSCKFLHDSPP